MKHNKKRRNLELRMKKSQPPLHSTAHPHPHPRPNPGPYHDLQYDPDPGPSPDDHVPQPVDPAYLLLDRQYILDLVKSVLLSRISKGDDWRLAARDPSISADIHALVQLAPLPLMYHTDVHLFVKMYTMANQAITSRFDKPVPSMGPVRLASFVDAFIVNLGSHNDSGPAYVPLAALVLLDRLLFSSGALFLTSTNFPSLYGVCFVLASQSIGDGFADVAWFARHLFMEPVELLELERKMLLTLGPLAHIDSTDDMECAVAMFREEAMGHTGSRQVPVGFKFAVMNAIHGTNMRPYVSGGIDGSLQAEWREERETVRIPPMNENPRMW